MPPLVFDVDRLMRSGFLAACEHHEVVTSTNDVARAHAVAGRQTPLLVVADRQTHGRGRGDHQWWSPEGNLMFSLLLSPAHLPVAARHSPLVSLAVGISVVESLMSELPACQVGLHWPNDVYVGGRKIAGILIEVLADGSHVIGVGVNTNNRTADAPAELRCTAISLRDLTGATHDHSALLDALLGRLRRKLELLGEMPTGIASRASALCLQRGRVLTVRHGSEEITGLCSGIDPNGALELETSSGQRRFLSGTIVRPVQSC